MARVEEDQILEVQEEQGPEVQNVDWLAMDQELFGEGGQAPAPENGSGSPDEPPADEPEGEPGDESADSEAAPDDDETGAPEPEPEVDYDLLVPMPDEAEGGAPVKLGDLKNELIDYRRRDNAIRRQELEMANERRVLEAVAANGGQVTPEIRQRMAQMSQERMEREAALMFQDNPEWTDPAVFSQAQKSLAKVARSFGYSDQEIAGLSDSRAVRMLKELNEWRTKAEASKQISQQAKVAKKRIGSKAPAKQPGKRSPVDVVRSAKRADGSVDWKSADDALGL